MIPLLFPVFLMPLAMFPYFSVSRTSKLRGLSVLAYATWFLYMGWTLYTFALKEHMSKPWNWGHWTLVTIILVCPLFAGLVVGRHFVDRKASKQLAEGN